MNTKSGQLAQVRVAIVATNDFEEDELVKPRESARGRGCARYGDCPQGGADSGDEA